MKIFYDGFTCAEDVFAYWNEEFDPNIEFIYASLDGTVDFVIFLDNGKLRSKFHGCKRYGISIQLWFNTVFIMSRNIQAQKNLRERFAKLLPFV